MKQLRKCLAEKESQGTIGAIINLELMTNWHGQHGAKAVLDGDINGWANLDRALHYLAPGAQIFRRGLTASRPAGVLAHAMVFGERAIVKAVGTRLLASLDDGTTLWEYSAFGAFMLKLWGMYQAQEIDVARPGVAALGVFQGVLDAWHDESALGDALRQACDYHLEQTLERSPYPEFVWIPYRVFPADILAIEAVRRDLGLSTPAIDHPLMATPLAKVPPPESRPRMEPDPLLEEVLVRAKQEGLIT